MVFSFEFQTFAPKLLLKLKGSQNATGLEGTYLMDIKLKPKENYGFQILFTKKNIRHY